MGDEGKRGAAIELVRSLLTLHGQRLTAIIQNYIESYLQLYTSAPTEKWQCKLVAVQLFISIAIVGAVTAHGVSQVNPLCDIPAFLQTHIAPDLQSTNAAMHPMLKVSAIKWVQVFRNQMAKDLLASILAILLHHLTSHNVVIHSYAAIAIDKFLGTKRNNSHLFTSSDIYDLTPSLISNVQSMMIKKTEVIENEHLMRALNRVILTVGKHPCYKLDTLVWILEMVSKNPRNPYFLHSLFESIAAMIRFGASVEPLLPFASVALQEKETILHPYIWQLLAAAVEYSEVGEWPNNFCKVSSLLNHGATMKLSLPLSHSWKHASSNLTSMTRFKDCLESFKLYSQVDCMNHWRSPSSLCSFNHFQIINHCSHNPSS